MTTEDIAAGFRFLEQKYTQAAETARMVTASSLVDRLAIVVYHIVLFEGGIEAGLGDTKGFVGRCEEHLFSVFAPWLDDPDYWELERRVRESCQEVHTIVRRCL